MDTNQTSSGGSRRLYLFAIFMVIWVAYVTHKDENHIKSSDKSEHEKTIENQFSFWDGSHNGLTEVIKQQMNDPSSYEHVETRYSDKGDYLIVFTKYRGNNKFGGKVLASIKAKVDLEGNVIEIIE